MGTPNPAIISIIFALDSINANLKFFIILYHNSNYHNDYRYSQTVQIDTNIPYLYDICILAVPQA